MRLVTATIFMASNNTPAVKIERVCIFDKLGGATRLELALRATEWLWGPEDPDAAGIAVKKQEAQT
jgi:hypothetical protein